MTDDRAQLGSDDGEESESRAAERTLAARLATFRRRAAAVDSRPEVVKAAEKLRERLPGDERYGDPLSLAGRGPQQLLGQGLAAVQPRRESALHQLGLAALQVIQAAAEGSGRLRADRLVVLVFTDLVDFSTWALEVGDAAAVDYVREVAAISGEAAAGHGGRVVKHLGDGWMLAFGDVADAVAAALEIQRRVRELALRSGGPSLRAGLHCGSPHAVGRDYLGVDVNVAARVAEAARGDQVLISDAAVAELEDDDDFELGRGKRLRATGAPAGMRVHAISARA